MGVVSFLIADYFHEAGLPAAVLRERALAGEPTAMQIVLDRVVARGEIEADRLSPRIASLPLDLMRHDLIMNRSTVSDPTLIEIVDTLFLPVPGPNPRPAGSDRTPATSPTFKATSRPETSLPG